jgi:hypothetical protein
VNYRLAILCIQQNVEYRINKGPLGLSKDISHHVMEYRSPIISPHSVKSFHDLHRELQVPVMPPTLTDVCRVIEIYYVLRVSYHDTYKCFILDIVRLLTLLLHLHQKKAFASAVCIAFLRLLCGQVESMLIIIWKTTIFLQ